MIRLAPCLLLTCLLLSGPAALAVGPGERAPGFSAPALLGSKASLSLADYRGKVVYLDFWASWCAPCAVSLPALDALRREFPSERFAVLAVNVDSDPARARRFLERRPVGYPSASDPEGRIPESFGLETMPTAYLIDAGGVVRRVHRGFRKGDVEVLRREIRELLGSQAGRGR